jgi:hypothetical protein
LQLSYCISSLPDLILKLSPISHDYQLLSIILWATCGEMSFGLEEDSVCGAVKLLVIDWWEAEMEMEVKRVRRLWHGRGGKSRGLGRRWDVAEFDFGSFRRGNGGESRHWASGRSPRVKEEE